MSSKNNGVDSLQINAEVESLSTNENQTIIHYNFDDSKGSQFNYFTSSEVGKPYIGMRGSLQISKEPLGDYILVNSSKDKFNNISHEFKRINPDEKINDENLITIVTNYDPEWFKLLERFNISVTMDNN